MRRRHQTLTCTLVSPGSERDHSRQNPSRSASFSNNRRWNRVSQRSRRWCKTCSSVCGPTAIPSRSVDTAGRDDVDNRAEFPSLAQWPNDLVPIDVEGGEVGWSRGADVDQWAVVYSNIVRLSPRLASRALPPRLTPHLDSSPLSAPSMILSSRPNPTSSPPLSPSRRPSLPRTLAHPAPTTPASSSPQWTPSHLPMLFNMRQRRRTVLAPSCWGGCRCSARRLTDFIP